MAFSRKQYEHDQKYLKENIKLVNFSINKRKPEDMEMLEWLNSREEGIGAYVKSLIRRDMTEPIESYKIFYNRFKNCHDCNNCGRKGCEYSPDPGENCRLNCPLWLPQK